MATKALIAPVPKQTLFKWQRVLDREIGVDGGIYESTTEERDITRAPGTKYTMCARPSISLGGMLNTGELLEYVPNQYKDEKAYKSKEWETILKGAEETLLQTQLEYKHGRTPGFYTNQIATDGRKVKDEEIPFLQTAAAQLNLNDGITVLDMNNPLHELMYYIARANNSIANSYQEITSLTPFYITREEEEVEIKTNKKRQGNIAVARLEEIAELQDNTIVQFCYALAQKVKSPSIKQAYNILDEYIKKNQTQRQEFLALYNIWKDPAKKAEFTARALFHELINYNVIFQRGGEYSWQPPQDDMGKFPDKITWDRYSDAVNYIADEKHQPEVDQMQRILQLKKGL